MRNKLQKFTEFSQTLLPHETQYLLSVQNLEDTVRLEILKQVDFNSRQIKQFTPYDPGIDKRKYSHLKNWIQSRLREIDVDEQFEWIIDMERKVTTDAILPSEEKLLLRAIRQYKPPLFFFSKFYELLQIYRHFLLIRLRYADHQLVHEFLERFRDAYEQSKRLNEQLHQATRDITQQYSDNSAESIQWEQWLTRIFYDEKLDGYTRYMAFVRLTFISFNYRKLDLLPEKFQMLDQILLQGKFYSKRILLNYYDLRMLLHARLRETDQAVYYGNLAIRGKTHDYLFYVNNLSAVLLRAGRAQEALVVMRAASGEMRETKNFYNKIGFVAFYVKSLLYNELYKNAESYAETFLKAYEKEILQYRWHTFFTAYLEAMVRQQNYPKILKVAEKYRLLEKERKHESRADYIPSILWYTSVAQYKEGLIEKSVLRQKFEHYLISSRQDPQRPQVIELLTELRPLVPEVLNPIPFSPNNP